MKAAIFVVILSHHENLRATSLVLLQLLQISLTVPDQNDGTFVILNSS
jgi:hypothetical protein